MGKLIVIEGLDGSGKSTQLELLPSGLKSIGIDSKTVSFPDYESDSSALVKMYLSGQFGKKPDDVNAYAASCFYAVDRYASYKTAWGEYYNGGGTVVAGGVIAASIANAATITGISIVGGVIVLVGVAELENGKNLIVISVNEKGKYSQIIADGFYSKVK